jgi:hypothetical protein
MPICHKVHFDSITKKYLPHDYVAGNCIQEGSQATLGFRSFLLATYPDYRSADYETSLRRQEFVAKEEEC